MQNKKLVLVFKDDVAINLEPITVETEKIVDDLLGDMVVSKSHVYCG
jgi:hypothetical protein